MNDVTLHAMLHLNQRMILVRATARPGIVHGSHGYLFIDRDDDFPYASEPGIKSTMVGNNGPIYLTKDAAINGALDIVRRQLGVHQNTLVQLRRNEVQLLSMLSEGFSKTGS